MTYKRYIATILLLVISTVSFSTSTHALDFFSAEKFEDVAALPGSSLGAPSGMVSSWGSVFAAIGGLTNTPVSDAVQGSSSVGMGVGDSINSIGATITLALGSVSFDGGFLERGAFGVSIGKFFTDWQMGVAIGGINVGGWNKISTKPKSSSYFAVTKIIPIDEHPIIVSVGAGTNAFAPITSATPEDETGAFIGVGVYLTPQISFIVDYTSEILSVGTSMVPFADLPLVFTFGAYDVNTVVPNHPNVSFTGSMAYSMSF